MDEQLRLENESLQASLQEVQSQFRLLAEEKAQIQKCYDQAIQEVADSEAKRETADKELRLAHSQIDSMWEELNSLRQRLDGPPTQQLSPKPGVQQAHEESPLSKPREPREGSNESLTLLCGLCKQVISNHEESPAHTTPQTLTNGIITSQQQQQQLKQQSQQKLHQQELHHHHHNEQKGSPKQPQKTKRTSWFNRRQLRVQDLESHSKVCYSNSQSAPNSPGRKAIANASPKSRRKFLGSRASQSPGRALGIKGEDAGEGAEYLMVNVTRSSHGATDMAPFKVVTKTNIPSFPSLLMEVHRSQGDFQWLHAALQGACPERIVPPLRPPISLDATISEFQRFLSRLAAHKVLSKHHLFVSFLSGTSEEMRTLRAKHRPRNQGNRSRYKPVVGRDTSSGPLVDTKDYLTMLEQNLSGLSSHLEQSARKGYSSPMERAAHWFRAISDSEPDHTYLKKASTDLARTCESMDVQFRDSEELLFIQNLQSLTDYIRVAQDLLSRVEESVDEYLYWDEELTLIESINSSSDGIEDSCSSGVVMGVINTSAPEAVFDDSGVSDVASNSTNSTGGDVLPPDCHMTSKEGSQDSSSDIAGCATSERWANATKQCADSKEFLEHMCAELAEELSVFDLHKEQELKQILLDYASAQLERHEKFQGKWFAIKYLLDSAVTPDKRAIQFTPNPTTTTPTNDDSQSEASL